MKGKAIEKKLHKLSSPEEEKSSYPSNLNDP